MGFFKTILFHLLLSFRGPILYLSKVLALVFLAVLGMMILLPELQQTPLAAKMMMATFGILFTSTFWFYDYLILFFKPKMLDIMLMK
jgi:hypothetical protein